MQSLKKPWFLKYSRNQSDRGSCNSEPPFKPALSSSTFLVTRFQAIVPSMFFICSCFTFSLMLTDIYQSATMKSSPRMAWLQRYYMNLYCGRWLLTNSSTSLAFIIPLPYNSLLEWTSTGQLLISCVWRNLEFLYRTASPNKPLSSKIWVG